MSGSHHYHAPQVGRPPQREDDGDRPPTPPLHEHSELKSGLSTPPAASQPTTALISPNAIASDSSAPIPVASTNIRTPPLNSDGTAGSATASSKVDSESASPTTAVNAAAAPSITASDTARENSTTISPRKDSKLDGGGDSDAEFNRREAMFDEKLELNMRQALFLMDYAADGIPLPPMHLYRPATDRQLLIRRIVWWSKSALGYVLAIFMILPFVERPYWCMYSSCNDHTDMYFAHTDWIPTDISLALELFCYSVILVGEALQAASQGWDVIQVQTPRLLSLGMSAFGVMDIVLTLALTRTGHWPYFTPFLRPLLFLFYSHERLTNMINILRAIPAVMEIIVLVFVLLFFYAWCAVLVFHDTDQDAIFGSFYQIVVQLHIYLTTANSPDVMIPAFKSSFLSFLFFGSFLTLGLWFLMPLLLAAIFNHYQQTTQTARKEFEGRRVQALTAAYVLLDVRGEGSLRPRVLTNLIAQTYAHPWKPLRIEDSVRIVQWMVDHTVEGQNARVPFILIWFPSVAGWRAYHMLSDFVRRPLFNRIIDAFVLGNGGAVLGETIAIVKQHDTGYNVFRSFELFFTAMFCLEVICLLLVYGWFVYWQSYKQRLDFILTVLSAWGSFFMRDVWADYARFFLLLRLVRLMSLMSVSKQFRVIFRTFFDSLPKFYNIFSSVVFFFYVFNALGIYVFGGLIYPSNPSMANSDFGVLYYWPINFNDWASGMVYLFDFLVVNNWQFLTSGLITSSQSEWARLFSVAFVLISVNVIMNLVIALVIDAFLQQWNKSRTEATDEIV